jgi:hypothetical protein
MNTSGVEPAQSNMPKPNSEGQARNNLLISSAVSAAIILSPIIIAIPALLNGRTLLPPGDMAPGLFDARILIGKILSSGQLPLWNPYAQAGIPLIAAAYVGALNPLNWIFVFFSPATAVNIIAIITNQLAMAGCYLFARRVNLSRPAAVIVAAIYALAALNVLPAVYIENGATVMTAAWTPWVMLALENLYRRAEWRWVALGAAFLALQFFAGDVQISSYAFLLSVGYICYSRIYRESSAGFLKAAAVMLLCGSLLSMIQLLPVRESFMTGNNDQVLGELFLPHGVSSSVYPLAIYSYICALTTLSILVGLYTRRFSSLFRLWASVSIISVALGQLPTRLHEGIFGWIPMYGLFLGPSGPLYFSAFATAVLCGLAFTGLSKVSLKVTNHSNLVVASSGALIILAPLMSMLLMSLSGVPASHIYSRLASPDFAKFIISREKEEEGARVIDLTGTVSNAGGATPREYQDPQDVSRAHGLRIINSPGQISLPYLSEVAGGLKIDGAIGDRNLLMSYHQGLNLLNVKYLLLADKKTDPVEQPAGLLNVDGVKFDRDKLGITLRRGNKVNITTEAGIIASEVALISHMSFSEQVADDAVVCVVRLHTRKDGILTREMRAGKDTAERSYDKPEILHTIKHKKARVAVSGLPDEFAGEDYIATLKFDRAEVNKIEIEHINPQPLLSIQHISLHDSETRESVPITSRDLIDDRWRKVEQFGDVGVYENRATTSRAWFVERIVAVTESEMPEIIKSGVLPDGTPFDPRETVLINRMEFDRNGAKLPIIGGRDGATVTIDYSDTNRIELTTQNVNQGYLVLSEPYYRGWDAFVDGKRTPVNRVNCVLQGIPVAAGGHKVEFKYRPPTVRNGASYTLLSVLILIAGVFVWRLSPGRVYSLVTSTFPSVSFDNPAAAHLRSLYGKLPFSEFYRETIAELQRRKRAWHEALQRDRANIAFETFVRTHFLYGLGMFLLAFILLSTLWPPFFEVTFEPDTYIERVRIFQDIFSGKTDIDDIQPPPDHVYFDGHFIIYAFASFVIKHGAALLSGLGFSTIAAENVSELIIFTIYFVNTGLLALACAFLFHFVLKVTKSIVPAMLFPLVFICSYQTITAFNLIRSDAFITSCLLILLCFSLSFALGHLNKHSYLVAGIFSALLVCAKVTGLQFLLIPLLAFFIQRKNAVFRNEMYKYALVLCIGTLLLQFRYIIYPGHVLSNAPAILTQMREWSALMSKTPLFYYNIDIYQSEPFFLALTLLGVVINIFGIRKNKLYLILLASFFFFSLLGLAAPKLPRWGYHIFLLALFLLITAHLYIAEKVRLTRWRRLYSLGVLLLAAGLLFDGGKNFLTTKRDLANRYNNELRVQIAAASWLRNNIPAKEKICILTASNWQMPPGDFNYVNEGFFIEYTNPDAVANYRLPDVSGLPASCPMFILGNAHLDLFGAMVTSHNPHLDWYGYFAMLEKRFPPVVFESEDKKNWLKIFRFNSHNTR